MESDLKTQIKKLQRLRDQIKTWQQSNEIKDKKSLHDSRRSIETVRGCERCSLQSLANGLISCKADLPLSFSLALDTPALQQMERFKATEKEMKTKAYSKEGLIAAARLDPAEQAKVEMCGWISSQVDELSRQIESAEAEVEQMQSGGTKKKKSSSAGATAEKAANLEYLNERRQWHSSRLEILHRMVENGELEPERVGEIKEDVSYFVESNAEEEFEEDEGIYDEFDLEEQEDDQAGKGDDDAVSNHEDTSMVDETPPPPPPVQATPVKTPAKESAAKRRESESKEDGSAASSSNHKKSGSAANAGAPTQTARKASDTATRANPSEIKIPQVPPANFAAAKQSPVAASSPSQQITSPAKPAPASVLPPIRYAAAAAAAVGSGAPPAGVLPASGTTETSSAVPTDAPVPEQSAPLDTSAAANSEESSAAPPSAPPGLTRAQAATVNGGKESPIASNASARQDSAPAESTPRSAQRSPNAASAQAPFQAASLSGASPAASAVQPSGGSAAAAPSSTTSGAESRLPSSLADLVTSFESAKLRSMNRGSSDNEATMSSLHKSLESSFMNVPEPLDSEKPKYYVPKDPYPTPAYYPQAPASLFDDPSIYSKFDEDTLFYIFYYQQGTYHQYLAARELKKQSWRFHKQFLTWFRRHSEPQAITDEYEQGVYVYFDWEGSWAQRKKSDFRFEYRWLED